FSNCHAAACPRHFQPYIKNCIDFPVKAGEGFGYEGCVVLPDAFCKPSASGITRPLRILLRDPRPVIKPYGRELQSVCVFTLARPRTRDRVSCPGGLRSRLRRLRA